MKAIILLTLCLNTAFAGGVNEGGTAGGTGSGTKPAIFAMNSEDADTIEAGKKCLSFYTAQAVEKEMTVEELKKAILAEVNKDAAPKARSMGRSIASVEEDAPSKKSTSMECHLFAKDTGDKAFLNQLSPTAPVSSSEKTQETRASGSTR